MTSMGSGANSLVDIRLVPALEADIRDYVNYGQERHSRDGMDALTDAFWFNKDEVKEIVEKCL
ncbi:hypothetical protein GGI21_003113, partial [Coemansia aciculifera]